MVQTVEAGALAVMVPLLVKGLRERSTQVKRLTAVIIDNMSKLVGDPLDAAPFLPRLIPELEKVTPGFHEGICWVSVGFHYNYPPPMHVCSALHVLQSTPLIT